MTLAVKDLTHAYGAKQALDGVGFSIESGAFCALLGPNGAGKTTLFSLLTRLFVPLKGDIEIAGISLSRAPRQALAKMGVVFQQQTLDLDLTVLQNLRYFAALHGLSGAAATDAISRALDRLDMAERAGEKVRALNGGHRRRMEIARALIHRPSILLLDEPTVGLDTRTRSLVTEYVHRLAQEDRLTVLWATHLVDEVYADDQLLVLHQGRIVADDQCAAITAGEALGQVFSRMTDGDVS